VPVPERIATFDWDGTLWCEKPVYGRDDRSLNGPYRVSSFDQSGVKRRAGGDSKSGGNDRTEK
jgi:hypothetical protein